jgi:DNA-binding transcriptional LysR family regulator
MVSNLRTLDFQQITSFVTVTRAGGVSAAAGQLGLAKSAVSKHVSQLEELLQVKLLERSSRRVSLTREGEHLFARLESLLAEGQRLLEQANEEHDRVEGVVRIAATPDFGGLVAERFFPVVLERHPGLELVMEPSYGFADLQDPAFDLAFRVGQVKDDRLIARPLGAFRRALVASPGYLRAHPTKTPAALAERACLVFSDSRTHAEWELERVEDGNKLVVPVRGKLAIKSFRILISLARQGAGIALVPDFLVHESIVQGHLARCLPDLASPTTPVFLTYRVGSDKIRRIRAVLDLALTHVPALLGEHLRVAIPHGRVPRPTGAPAGARASPPPTSRRAARRRRPAP